MFREIIRYRDLLYMLTLRDIKIRYKQAAMGYLWALFMPMVAIAAGILVKTAMSFASKQPFDLAGVVSISVKVLPWTFFISAIKFSVNSLVGNRELITKIYFPREVFPFASILACLFDFVIAAVTLVVLLCFAHTGVSIYLLFLPVLLLLFILLTAGLSLLLAAANLFFRDVKYIVEIILMFGIFFTPVFYSADSFGRFRFFLLANPVGSLLEAMNNVVVLHKMPSLIWFSYAAIASIALFVLGLFVFHKTEPMFAENI